MLFALKIGLQGIKSRAYVTGRAKCSGYQTARCGPRNQESQELGGAGKPLLLQNAGITLDAGFALD